MASSITARQDLANAYAGKAVSAALFTTAPSGDTAGTEVSGGSYARQAPQWTAADASAQVTFPALSFQVPAGTTIAGAGFYASDGTYFDGGAVTPQTFSSAGIYNLTGSYTES